MQPRILAELEFDHPVPWSQAHPGLQIWAGVDDGRLPSLSQMQMFMAATILEGGCRETSGRIHMNSAGGHENSATGYVVAERPLFELSTA